ncbi:hypothetical protein Tco_0860302 [Tanacetum coccineum]|uniref:Uncharacterized protein n=1 Tax=Tanacetum coccineum TaxID=301880 RepID=A0ABQ5BEJ5_9ASTR
MCDVPLCENTTSLNALNEHSETIVDYNDDSTSSDDDSYENIDYVDASPPDVEIVSLEVVEIVDPEIDSLRDNLILSSDVVIKSTSHFLFFSWRRLTPLIILFPNLKLFSFNLEEISSGSPTTHSELSLLIIKLSTLITIIFKFPLPDSVTFIMRSSADAHHSHHDFPDVRLYCLQYPLSFNPSASFWESRTDNQEKDEKQSQNDKTGLGMEKTVKDKAKSKPERAWRIAKLSSPCGCVGIVVVMVLDGYGRGEGFGFGQDWPSPL